MDKTASKPFEIFTPGRKADIWHGHITKTAAD